MANLKSVSQFAAMTAFSEPQLRWWIFHSNENGMAASGAVVRIGARRVYIDVDGFDAWLRTQNPDLIASPKPAPTPSQAAYEMRDDGASIRQIAAKTGIPKTTVDRLLRAAPPTAFIEHLESIQACILNAMESLRRHDESGAESALRKASVATSQAIAACAEVQP